MTLPASRLLLPSSLFAQSVHIGTLTHLDYACGSIGLESLNEVEVVSEEVGDLLSRAVARKE